MFFRKGLKTVIASGLCIAMAMPVPALGAVPTDTAEPVSNVDNSRSTYERQVLEVAGEPFFFNGVQIRIDKLKDFYHYSDEQIENLFQIAKDDGFTAANVQLRWMDIQPDQSFAAVETGTIRGGQYAGQTVPGEETMQAGYSENPDDQAISYIKFDFGEMEESEWTAAKLRIWVDSVTDLNSLRLYGITDDSWNASAMTWNSGAPGHNGYDITGDAIDLGTTPSYDPVNQAQYYDFDVTDFINQHCGGDKKASFMLRTDTSTESTVKIDGVNGQKAAPELVLSRDDVYNWDYLDKVIGWAEKADIKLELLWFATDTVNSTIDNRVPYYVFQKYQESVDKNGDPFFLKNSDPVYGTYWFLMCKNDPNLREKEKEAVKAMFNHIAEYNQENGNKNTVVGCQVANEPAVGRLHQTWKGEHCYCDVCKEKKGSMSDQDFRDLTMWEYTDNLAAGVKESDYSVWTRVNNYTGTDAYGVTYNEKMRRENGTNVDFIGPDPYGAGTDICYRFGHETTWLGNYAQGDNLTMVMENSGSNSGTPNFILAALAGGSFYNVYDLCSPDGNGLYDNQDGIPVAHGDYVEDMRNINHMLNKISFDLATKTADGAGGKKLIFFNELGTPSPDVSKKIKSIDVNYNSSENGVGIAVDKGDREIILESTRDAEFTLNGLAGYGISSVETGAFDEENNWIKSDDSDVDYTLEGNNMIVSIPAYSCIRLVTDNAIALGESRFEVEALTYQLSDGAKLEGFLDNGAGGTWMKVNAEREGEYVEFDINAPASDFEYEVVAGYREGNAGGTAQLSVNGEDCNDSVDMYHSGSKFVEASFGNVKFDEDGVKKFRFTVTGKNEASSGYEIGLDYICLIPQVPEVGRTAVVNGDVSGLPETIEMLENGETVEKKIIWNVKPEDLMENYSTVLVSGTIEGSNLNVQTTVDVVPANLVYYIDCNSEDSESYEAVKKLDMPLLNDKADQQWESGESWGITGGYDGKKSNDDGNKFHDGYYGKNKSGKENGYAYKLTLEPGEYNVTVQSHEWWSDSRSTNFEAVYTDSEGKEVSTMIAEDVKVGGGAGTDEMRTGRLSVDHETEVTIHIYASGDKGAVITFLAVAGAEDVRKDALETLVKAAKEEAEKAGLYTKETADKLKAAITASEKVLAAENASQKSVDNQTAVLQKALDELEILDSAYYVYKIKVTEKPDKMSYEVGESFDPAGMEVTVYEKASPSDAAQAEAGEKEDSEADGISLATPGSASKRERILTSDDYDVEYDFDTAGTKKVTVSYAAQNQDGEDDIFEDSFSVKVMEPWTEEYYTEKIEITKNPDKMEYEVGDDFDPSGMKVAAYEVTSSSNAKRREKVLSSSDYELDYDFSAPGTKKVTVTYCAENKDGKDTEFTDSISVRVVKTEEMPVYYTKEIKVLERPDKTVYYTDEIFNPSGMKVAAYEVASSSNASRREKELSEDEYELEIPDFTTAGNKTIKVIYQAEDSRGELAVFRDSFTVKVAERPSYESGDDDGNSGDTNVTTHNRTGEVSGTWQGGENTGWKFLKSDGSYAVNEWAKINGIWYHFGQDTQMQTGWLKDQNKWYLLNPDGSMCADTWALVDGKWYFLNQDGSMKCNEWYFYKNVWYYLGSDGGMLVNSVTPDGYQLDAEGRWIS